MEFFDVLVRYEVTLWNAVDAELVRKGQIGLAVLHALRLVGARRGETRVQDLSDGIGITVGAASKLVDRLERDGLAVRRPNPDDRRSSLIGLTHTGEEALASGLEVFGAAVDRALGDEDVRPLTAALERLSTRLEAAGAGVAA